MSNKVKVPGGAFYAGDGLTVDQTTRTVSAGGGGSVSTPDWNQNDATASDYIKNRPFYTGDPAETVLVEETTIPFEEERGDYFGELESTFSATVGETYKVSWDGTVYECTCFEFHNDLLIGNLSIAGEGSDTGEPFLMLVENGRGILINTADTSASHTISISGIVTPVVKINPKYIRDMYYTGDPVETVLVEESTVSFTAKNGVYMGELQSTFSATVGETYKVSWDGTVYECTCFEFHNDLRIGNLSIAGEGSDTGEPFLIGIFNVGRIEIVTPNTSASHTISISGIVIQVVKIDAKYLPENLATKSDVDEKLGNCIKTVNGTAPDASGNVEVQTISEDALSTNQYGTVIIVKNGVVFKNRLNQYGSISIGESNVAFLVKKGETSNVNDTIFAFCAANDKDNNASSDVIRLSRNGIDFHSKNVVIKSLGPNNAPVGVIQLNDSTSHGVMVEITKDACFVLPSSTSGSSKKFKITVDDSGKISATEVTV